MKTEFSLPTMVLTGAVAAVLLTGCASMNQDYSGTITPGSSMAFAPVTDPKELVKWSGSSFHGVVRSADVYYFVVPDTGYNAGGDMAYMSMPENTQSYSEDRGAVGGPGPYQRESGGYRVIRHQPNQR